MAAKFAKTISRADYTSSKRKRYPKRKRSKAPVIILVSILAVLLAAGGIVGYYGYKLYSSAMQVRAEAKWMMSQVSPLKEAIKTGDEQALDETVQGLMEKAAWIDAETHTDLWELATKIPVYGEDIVTAQKLGEISVTLTRDILYPVSQSIGGIKLSTLFQDGRINVELLQELSETLSTYLPLINEQVALIRSLPPAHLPQVQNVLDKLQDPLGEYGPLLETIDQYLPMIPPMLGANGETRTYLILAMGNSEIRSVGGFPGAWGTLLVTDGGFHLGQFESKITHTYGMEVEAREGEEVYNLGIFTTPASVTAMPNFDRAGEIAAEYWRQFSGQEVDGVVAIDPVALQHLIGVTGGEFDVSDGTHIDGSNAAYEILHNVYVRYWNDGDSHDAFFAEIAQNTFSTFFSNLGRAEMGKLIKTVRRLGNEGRMVFWMANPEEEAMVCNFGFGGEYPSDPLKPVVGFYLNDRTWGKIDWFMKVDVTVSEPTYNADGTATYDVTFVLTNTMTYDFANNNTIYITGVNKKLKRDVTDMITGIVIALPRDAVLESFSSDPEHSSATGMVDGIQIIKTDSYDLGGTSSSITLRITVPAGAEPLTVHVTPLAQEQNLNIVYEYQKDSVS